MKLRVPLFLALFLAALVAAYAVGFWRAKALMDTFCGFVISGSSAGDHTLLFAKHSEAINALQAGDTARAEKILRFLAHSDATRIHECTNEPECARYMGNPPPDEALLKAAVAR